MSVTRAFKLLSMLKSLVKNEYLSATDLMGELHGMPQKIGQHLTLYKGTDLNAYFEQLCVNSKPVEIPVQKLLNELGFTGQEITSVAQASIGQVYQMKGNQGVFAAKIKYPGIEKGIKKDFRFLRILAAPLKLTPFRNNGMLKLAGDLEKVMLKECDYSEEARIQSQFALLFKDHPNILVPDVVTFNDKVIVSEWVNGEPLLAGKNLTGKWFVETLLKFFLTSLNALGMVHGDPHPGNFIIQDEKGTKRLVVLDYGSVLILSSSQKLILCRLLLGDFASEQALKQGLAELGVPQETLEAYEPILGDLVTILLEPFYYPGEYDFADWRFQYKMNTLLGSQRWEQPLGFSPVMLMLSRTLHGLYYYTRAGAVKLNWYELAREYLR